MKQLRFLPLFAAFFLAGTSAYGQLLSVLPIDCRTKNFAVYPLDDLVILDTVTKQVYQSKVVGDFRVFDLEIRDKHAVIAIANSVSDTFYCDDDDSDAIRHGNNSTIILAIGLDYDKIDYKKFSMFERAMLVKAPVSSIKSVKISPAIDAFVAVEREPKPLNIDEISDAIHKEKIPSEYLEGTVVARILVDEYGRYVRHKILRAPNEILVTAVEKNLRLLKFSPAIQAGEPIACWVMAPIRFAK